MKFWSELFLIITASLFVGTHVGAWAGLATLFGLVAVW